MSDDLSRTVAILGSGPAAMMAAHACVMTETPYCIFTREGKSTIGGAQYLHEAIPGLTSENPDFHVRNVVEGDVDTYRVKVYGKDTGNLRADQDVSFVEAARTPFQPAWSLAEPYDRIYRAMEQGFNYVDDVAPMVPEMVDKFGIVFSTIPLNMLCNDPAHLFRMTRVWILTEAPSDVPEWTVVYNGTKDTSWYRASRLDGTVGGREYGPDAPLPPGQAENLRTILKPTFHTCTCEHGVIPIGRYGKWKKGELVHHAFKDAFTLLEVMKETGS